MRILGKEHVIILLISIYQCIISDLQHFQSQTGVAKAKYRMEDGEQHQSSHAPRQSKTNWTAKMNMDLLNCREKAKSSHTRADCQRKPNGRKTGVMELTKILWEAIGYADLGKKAQNLRDQAARIEKMTITEQQTIQNEIIEQIECQIQNNPALNNVETEQRSIENLPFTPDAELDSHFKGIQEKDKQKYLDVKTIPGDWSRHVKNCKTCKEFLWVWKCIAQRKNQRNTCGM